MFIAALFTIDRTWKQPRCPSADEWIKKCWYMYTMGSYSAIKRNAFESVLMRWMNLEPITQSEISQKEENKCILKHMESRKMGLSSRDTDLANRLVDPVGKGKGGMNWKSSIETWTLLYVKYITSGNWLYDARSSNSALWQAQEWNGVGGRKEVQKEGDVCIPVADSCWCMAETNKIL